MKLTDEERQRGLELGTPVQRFDRTPTLAIFRIEPEGEVPGFEPGQFVTLGC